MAWYEQRPLPEGGINAYTTTDNLANMVELAIGSMKLGKAIARTILLAVKAKLEAQKDS